MTTRTVTWCSSELLPCIGLESAGAILCINPADILADGFTKEGTECGFLDALICGLFTKSSCPASYTYTFSYDDEVLADPARLVLSSDITGAFCKGCLTDWVFCNSGGGGEVCVEDSDSIDFELTETGCVTGEVNLSANSDNIISIEADGLFAECCEQELLAVTDTDSVNLTIGGTIPQTLSADVEISADVGNIISIHADGLYGTAGAQTPFSVTDTNSVDLTVGGTIPQTLSSDVKISADVGNIISIHSDGLYGTAGAQTPLSVSDTNSVDLTIGGTIPQTLSADTKISADAGNRTSIHADGLYSDQAVLAVTDTNSIDLTIGGSIPQTVSADAKISADAGNIISIHSDGLFAEASATGGCCCWSTVLLATIPATPSASDLIYRRGSTNWNPWNWSTNTPYMGLGFGNIPAPVSATSGSPYDKSVAFSPGNDFFYLLSTAGSGSTGTITICDTSDIVNPAFISTVSIDFSLCTGLTSFSGPSLACDPTTGILYFTYSGSGGNTVIGTVNPVTGVAVIVGSTGAGAAFTPDLMFDPSGQMYLVDGTAVKPCNKATGALSATIWSLSGNIRHCEGYDGVSGYVFRLNAGSDVKYDIAGASLGTAASSAQGFLYADSAPTTTQYFTRYFCTDGEGVVTFTDLDLLTGEELDAWPDGTTFSFPG